MFRVKVSYRKFSIALVLLILASSLLLSPHVFWVVTNPDFYTSLVGLVWIASVVPYFLVVIGCVLFLLRKRYALATILVGGVLSFFGATWSYIPFFPLLSPDPIVRIALMVIGNLSVLAVLAWSVRRQRSDPDAAESPK